MAAGYGRERPTDKHSDFTRRPARACLRHVPWRACLGNRRSGQACERTRLAAAHDCLGARGQRLAVQLVQASGAWNWTTTSSGPACSASHRCGTSSMSPYQAKSGRFSRPIGMPCRPAKAVETGCTRTVRSPPRPARASAAPSSALLKGSTVIAVIGWCLRETAPAYRRPASRSRMASRASPVALRRVRSTKTVRCSRARVPKNGQRRDFGLGDKGDAAPPPKRSMMSSQLV